jgi:hypothetical protein
VGFNEYEARVVNNYGWQHYRHLFTEFERTVEPRISIEMKSENMSHELRAERLARHCGPPDTAVTNAVILWGMEFSKTRQKGNHAAVALNKTSAILVLATKKDGETDAQTWSHMRCERCRGLLVENVVRVNTLFMNK